jgi:hypothetical protein
MGITYDTGALLAAEQNDRTMWALHRRALERGVVPNVPAGVLAEGSRGGPQASTSRLLVGCRVEPLSETAARASGAAAARARRNDVVDASVVVGAITRGDAIVTSDPDDLRALAHALGAAVLLHEI